MPRLPARTPATKESARLAAQLAGCSAGCSAGWLGCLYWRSGGSDGRMVRSASGLLQFSFRDRCIASSPVGARETHAQRPGFAWGRFPGPAGHAACPSAHRVRRAGVCLGVEAAGVSCGRKQAKTRAQESARNPTTQRRAYDDGTLAHFLPRFPASALHLPDVHAPLARSKSSSSINRSRLTRFRLDDRSQHRQASNLARCFHQARPAACCCSVGYLRLARSSLGYDRRY